MVWTLPQSLMVACLLTLVPIYGVAANERASVISTFEKQTQTRPDGAHMNTYLRSGIGPTLVLVPGTWGDFLSFEAMIGALPTSMPVAVIELRWQGGNQPPNLDMSIEQLADDVLVAVRVLGLERFVISGHSIGGMIAVEIAGRDVPGLVGAIPMEGWTDHSVVTSAFDGVVTANLTAEEMELSQANRARGQAHLSEAQRKAIGTIWRAWDGYAGLTRSTLPILSLWGDRGKPRPNRDALRLPERENITIGWIEESSHALLVEAPNEVARHVTEFMAQFPTQPGRGQD